MERKPTIVATRALVREGETGKALQTILVALENDPRQTGAVRISRLFGICPPYSPAEYSTGWTTPFSVFTAFLP